MIKPVIFQRRRDYDLRRMDTRDDEHVFMRDAYRYGVDARVNAGYGLWQLAYGSKQTLNADNYKDRPRGADERQGRRGATDSACMPTHLVVPVERSRRRRSSCSTRTATRPAQRTSTATRPS